MSRAPHLLLMPPNWIGDVIMAQPAMRAIANHYHHMGCERITVSGRPWLRDLLPLLGLPAAEFSTIIPEADIAYLFPNSFRSAWQCRKAGIPRIIGYRGQWRRMLLSKSLPHRVSLKHEHHRGFYLDIARQMDIPVDQSQVMLQLSKECLTAGENALQQHGIDPARAICIAPGAQFGGAKCYPADSYHQVVSKLAVAGWQPVILGMEADRGVGEVILAGIDTPLWNAAGSTTLSSAIELIAASQLMLCNDSGLMHIAAGLGIATVTPFGATDPARTAPGGAKVRILYEPAACSPCLQRECSVEGHPCMRNITPEMLLDASLTMLEAGGEVDESSDC